MPSETDILNAALSKIGARRITAMDDDSTEANHCQVFYPLLRRSLLRSHHWNFAETRTELAQDATAPAFEFAFSYTLPPDLLKLKEYNGVNLDTSNLSLFESVDPSRYKVEGRKLYTNDGTVKIVYVKDETDPNVWDALFAQTLIAWLASDLAMAISKDSRLSQRMLEEAINLLLPMAAAVDGQEGSVNKFITDELIWGR